MTRGNSGSRASRRNIWCDPEIATQMLKPRMFCLTFFKQTEDGVYIVNPCIEDISDEFAIVKKDFLKEICLERCEIFECDFQKFEDSDEKMLIVCSKETIIRALMWQALSKILVEICYHRVDFP